MVINLIAMPDGTKSAIDAIQDEELKEDVLYVRRELCSLSTRKYVDAFDTSLNIIKNDLGMPDHEVRELLSIGLEEMVGFAQSYTQKSSAWNPGAYAPYGTKRKGSNS